jgi:TRAP-type C4-dicarboxylate transport system permease small subunit
VVAFNDEVGVITMIRTAHRGMIKSVEVFLIIGIALLVLFTAYEVCMREIFGKPTIWTNEITSYLLVWVGLLGVVYAYDKGAHVSVDLIFRRMDIRIQRFSNIITTILIFLFALCILIYGFNYWWIGYFRGWRHFGMLDVPMSYTRIALPITGLLLTFQVAITIYDHIRVLKSKGNEQKPGS